MVKQDEPFLCLLQVTEPVQIIKNETNYSLLEGETKRVSLMVPDVPGPLYRSKE
jgi:hypothetical protein